jgi:imidazolonepropionase-like amidohydrolase
MSEVDAAICNVNIVDVESGRVRPNCAILIKDGTIVDITNSDIPHQARIIIKFDKPSWAIPSLIECHAHLFEVHRGPQRGRLMVGETDEEAFSRALLNIKAAVNAGITTIRDMGAYRGRNNAIRRMAADQYGVEIKSCGLHLSRTDGHFSDRGLRIDDLGLSLEGAVAKIVEDGADFIKVMNDPIIFDEQQLRTICREAEGLGRYVACHAYSPRAVTIAMAAGVRTIEHAGGPQHSAAASYAPTADTFFCPTYVAAIDCYECLEEIVAAIPGASKELVDEWVAYLRKDLRASFAAHAPVIAGTDAGILPTDFSSLHRELAEYLALGASPLVALQSATSLAARALGVEKKGTIAVGYIADLLLLSANPLLDLSSILSNLLLVVVGGRIAVDHRDEADASDVDTASSMRHS